jgi:hypothetical protein
VYRNKFQPEYRTVGKLIDCPRYQLVFDFWLGKIRISFCASPKNYTWNEIERKDKMRKEKTIAKKMLHNWEEEY